MVYNFDCVNIRNYSFKDATYLICYNYFLKKFKNFFFIYWMMGKQEKSHQS